jgi:hypothetical protein
MTVKRVIRHVPFALGFLIFLGLSPAETAVSHAALAEFDDDSIAGSWVINWEKSDDPTEEFQKAQEELQEQQSGGRSRGGGAARGRRPASKSTTGRRVNVSPEQQRQIQATMRQALRAHEQLTISQTDSTVTISTGQGDRIYYTDNRELSVPIAADLDQTLKSKWDGDKLVVEGETEIGVETKFEYERDGDQLKVKVRIELLRPRQVVRFDLVYDPVD